MCFLFLVLQTGLRVLGQLPVSTGDNILEAGCGSGLMTMLLSKQGNHINCDIEHLPYSEEWPHLLQYITYFFYSPVANSYNTVVIMFPIRR